LQALPLWLKLSNDFLHDTDEPRRAEQLLAPGEVVPDRRQITR